MASPPNPTQKGDAQPDWRAPRWPWTLLSPQQRRDPPRAAAGPPRRPVASEEEDGRGLGSTIEARQPKQKKTRSFAAAAARRRRWSMPPMLARISRVVAFVGAVGGLGLASYVIITRRIDLGVSQKHALDALSDDPAAFVLYAVSEPEAVAPLGLEPDAHEAQAQLGKWQEAGDSPEAMESIFVGTYGDWLRTPADEAAAADSTANTNNKQEQPYADARAARAAEAAMARHCGAREFKLIAAGERDDLECRQTATTVETPTAAAASPMTPSSTGAAAAGVPIVTPHPGCRGGFYRDVAGRAVPAPDGTFSLDGQACLVLCARGAACNASRYDAADGTCRYDRHAAKAERPDPIVGRCPGSKWLTLCPSGSYCPTPIVAFDCPRGHFCALGASEPTPCGPLESCPSAMMDRPHTYYRVAFVLGLIGIVAVVGAICACCGGSDYDDALEASSSSSMCCDGFGSSRDDDGLLLRLARRVVFSRRRRHHRRVLRQLRGLPQHVVTTKSASSKKDHAATAEQPNGTTPTQQQKRKPLFRVDVTFERLTCVLGDGRVALEDASGQCLGGRVTAVVGPTGAGKSTLLRMLVRRAPPPRATLAPGGVVRFNGVDRARIPHAERLVGLVPQDDDALVPWLTVWETVRFAAVLRDAGGTDDGDDDPRDHNKRPTSKRQRAAHRAAARWCCCCREILDELDLTAQAPRRIAELSGGERKRVTCATELVRPRPCACLDEPTSGVDATTSVAVVAALRRTARRRGVAVVAVVHQPSARVWRHVDDCVVLGLGGAVRYVGPADAAAAAFDWKGAKPGSYCLLNGNGHSYYCGAPPSPQSAPEFILDCVSVTTTTTHDDGGPPPPGALRSLRTKAAASQAGPRCFAAERAESRRRRDVDAAADTPERGLFFFSTTTCFMTQRPPTCPWRRQCALFAVRAVRSVVRHPRDVLYDVGVVFAAGALASALYPRYAFREAQEVAFVVVLSLGFTVALASSRLFGEHRATAHRELSDRGGAHASASAFFVASLVAVDVPKLAVLVAAYVSAWYASAAPAAPFLAIYGPCLAAAFACSGLAHLVSVAFEKHAAHLSLIALLVAAAVSSGVAPTLRQLRARLGRVPAEMVSWTSYSRWLVEALFSVDIATKQSPAWRMPPTVYHKPRDESVLFYLMLLDYDARADALDCAILVVLGLGARALAFVALTEANRSHLGLPPLFGAEWRREHRERRLRAKAARMMMMMRKGGPGHHRAKKKSYADGDADVDALWAASSSSTSFSATSLPSLLRRAAAVADYLNGHAPRAAAARAADRRDGGAGVALLPADDDHRRHHRLRHSYRAVEETTGPPPPPEGTPSTAEEETKAHPGLHLTTIA